jgi:hypothetical protein
MKRTFLIVTIIILFAGCERQDSPVSASAQPESGNVAMVFDKAGAPSGVQTLTATLSRSGYPPIERSLSLSDTSAVILFTNVAIGAWKVQVDAKDLSGTVLFTGQSEVIVLENAVSQINLILVPVSTGVGSVQINVSWGTGKPTLFPKTYGGTSRDAAVCVIQTSDGGFAIGGVTYSYGTGGNAWLVKTNGQGVMQWQKNYGASGEDRINNIVQTPDGGYLFVGYKYSNGEDSWIVRLDSAGNLLWEKNVGSAGDDAFLILKRAADGSYLTCGYAYDGIYYDGQVVKFTPSGEVVWKRTLGGTGGDFAMNFIEQPDQRIIVSGYNGSNFSKHYDFWLFMLNANGSLAWEKTYGDSMEERSAGLLQLSNGTLLLSGYRSVYGKQDAFFMNIDSSGTLLWSKAYDIGAADFTVRLQHSPDNSVIASGYSTIGSKGQQGILMKLDNVGNAAWIKNYGGNGTEVFVEHRVLNDGSIIAAGTTSSSGNGGDDFWLVKTDGNGNIQ